MEEPEFVEVLLLFWRGRGGVNFFFWPGSTACGILVLQPTIQPRSSTVKAPVLTTGPPGNSQLVHFYILKDI